MVTPRRSLYLFLLLFCLIAQLMLFCNARRRGRQFHEKNRIIDGLDADDDEYPEYVVLGLPPDENYVYCAGVLLHPNIVLTVAHCVDDKDVKLINVSRTDYPPRKWTEVDRLFGSRVEAACISRDYFSSNKKYSDFAILRLEIDIPSPSYGVLAQEETMNGTTGIAFGLGYTDYDAEHPENNVLPDKARKLEMEVIECSEQNRHETNICFTSKYGGDVCFGDSGSPVFSKENREILGLTSLLNKGEICRHNYQARSVFSNVGRNQNLIEDLVEECLYGTPSKRHYKPQEDKRKVYHYRHRHS